MDRTFRQIPAYLLHGADAEQYDHRMQCPNCGSKARVFETEAVEDGRRTRRRLRCEGPVQHRFVTEEELLGFRLEKDVHIRHSGDEKVAPVPFSPHRLLEEISDAVIGRLSAAQTENVVDAAMAALRKGAVRTASPLTKDEYKTLEEKIGSRQPIGAIWDWQVRDAVEYQLRRVNRIAHILYALSFLGRPVKKVWLGPDHRIASKGWNSAEDLLSWLYKSPEYEDLREAIPARREKIAKHRWMPNPPEIHPSRVVKRAARTERDTIATKSGGSGGVVDFVESRFRRSIELAMLGRPQSVAKSQYISWWVLHDLAGQSTVHSSQLAVGVLDCLRRVDDVAYLRWATQLKEFHSVRAIKTEAISLITHPSEKLQFHDQGPRRKPVEVLG